MELENPLKYKILLKEFRDLRFSANDELTKDQFFNFLDRKVKGPGKTNLISFLDKWPL